MNKRQIIRNIIGSIPFVVLTCTVTGMVYNEGYKAGVSTREVVAVHSGDTVVYLNSANMTNIESDSAPAGVYVFTGGVAHRLSIVIKQK